MEKPTEIVVLDDSREDRELISFELKALGYDPIEIDPNEDVFEKLRQANTDILLIDFHMGIFTAFDIIKQKQVYKKYKHIVICSGGYLTPDDLKKYGLDDNRFAFIDKNDIKRGLTDYVSRFDTGGIEPDSLYSQRLS
jgi:CheY-like chemotaxis protein